MQFFLNGKKFVNGQCTHNAFSEKKMQFEGPEAAAA